MAIDELLMLLAQGPEAWNAWRAKAKSKHPDLRKANLAKAALSMCDLRDANLAGANLTHSNLAGAILRNADLTDANLTGANLAAATLTGAILRGADLNGTDFTIASLDGADFAGAKMSLTHFGDCDLRRVLGLEAAIHEFPSGIPLDTIYRSKGEIPESFLRGCGVPDSFIEQMRSLVGAEDGIQFYSCFISYSTKDEDFARRLHGRMRDERLRVWFAAEDLQGGKKVHEQIETAIRVYDKLLIVLSEACLQSEWVMTELRNARKAERQSGKRKLFPVRLVDFETLRDWECFDADGGKDLAVELREYFIPDFSNWKDHDVFEAAFSRLLKDLRAEEPPK